MVTIWKGQLKGWWIYGKNVDWQIKRVWGKLGRWGEILENAGRII